MSESSNEDIIKRMVEDGDSRVNGEGKTSMLYKSLMSVVMDTINDGKVQRLAFDRDPARNYHTNLYIPKSERSLPDAAIKKLVLTDDLVGTIIRRRQEMISRFGRPQRERSEMGFVVQKTQDFAIELARMPEQKREMLTKEMEKRASSIAAKLMTCGDKDAARDKLYFSEYLGLLARNAVAHGRVATEVVYEVDPHTGRQEFSYFRPVDVGTILQVRKNSTLNSEAMQPIREAALLEIQQLEGCVIDPAKWQQDGYEWIQIFDTGHPKQVFTDKELVCKNFFPVLDVELEQYPFTPIEIAVTSIVSHISLTVYNKLYFESGRSAKGLLLIRSDQMDEKQVEKIRQGFQAMITSNNNAHRMPVIGVDKEEEVEFQPFESGSKDMEFQYLSDMTARIIFSAFGMSPDEVPGWAYLSRGMSNQGLGESNNAFNLTATRDTALRSLLGDLEDYLNREIMPLLDPSWADKLVIRLVGLDAETPEKESIRLQQDLKIHYTFDDVLRKVEKPTIGRHMGGELPFSPDYQAKLDAYFTVGEILEFFCDRVGASKDPMLNYRRDPFWFQQRQLLLQEQMQNLQIQQAMAAPQGGPDQGGGPDGGSGKDAPSDMNAQDVARGGDSAQNLPKGNDPAQSTKGFDTKVDDLNANIDEAMNAVSKSERIRPNQMVQKQNSVVRNLVKDLEKEFQRAQEDLAKLLRPLS